MAGDGEPAAAPGLPGDLIAPRWGQATLADLLPAVLARLGVPDAPPAGALDVPEAPRYVVLLVDGLGARALDRHRDAAPYLAAASGEPLTAGFPSTTVTSLTSLGTGLPPGRHGLPGYTTWEAARSQVVHWLGWYAVGGREDLREELPPESVQPHPTAWELAEAAGVSVAVVNAAGFEGSGLTRAAFRGGRYVPTLTDGDAVAAVGEAAGRGYRSLVYAYLPHLDLMGHLRGPGTDPWLAELTLIDRFVAVLVDRLPAGTVLLVTGDHGMVTVGDRIDVDDETAGAPLRDGVVAVAGEPRMRHVHARPGAATEVLAAWRAVLGDRAHVITGDDAVTAGLFGPEVGTACRARIGDVLALARGGTAVVCPRREPRLSAMPGHHGSLTAEEVLVPLAVLPR